MASKIEKFGKEAFYRCGEGKEFSTDGKCMVYRLEGGPKGRRVSGERKDRAENAEKVIERMSFPHVLREEGMMDVVGAFRAGKSAGRGPYPLVMCLEGADLGVVRDGEDGMVGRFEIEERGPALYLSVYHLKTWPPAGEVRYGDKAAHWVTVYNRSEYNVLCMQCRPDERDFREAAAALGWEASGVES